MAPLPFSPDNQGSMISKNRFPVWLSDHRIPFHFASVHLQWAWGCTWWQHFGIYIWFSLCLLAFCVFCRIKWWTLHITLFLPYASPVNIVKKFNTYGIIYSPIRKRNCRLSKHQRDWMRKMETSVKQKWTYSHLVDGKEIGSPVNICNCLPLGP